MPTDTTWLRAYCDVFGRRIRHDDTAQHNYDVVRHGPPIFKGYSIEYPIFSTNKFHTYTSLDIEKTKNIVLHAYILIVSCLYIATISLYYIGRPYLNDIFIQI